MSVAAGSDSLARLKLGYGNGDGHGSAALELVWGSGDRLDGRSDAGPPRGHPVYPARRSVNEEMRGEPKPAPETYFAQMA